MENEQTRPDLGVERDQSAASVRAMLGLTPAEPVRVGRYELQERIGAGGMGVVYTARDPELGRTVALKILKGDVAAQAGSRGRERLIIEARAIAKLAHPNVIGVYEVGTHDGRVFMACEFVDGESLDVWLERPHERGEILEVFIGCARGLAAAHAAGIVHRDFKPSNAIVGHDGRVRVLDFGLARSLEDAEQATTSSGPSSHLGDAGGLTRTGAVMGTPAYMSPEQVKGRKVGPASDQFSFCIALAEALSGKRPFAHTDERPVLEAIARAEPELELRGNLSSRLRSILERGLRKKPEERYPSMEALVGELERVLAPRWPKFALAGAVVVAVGAGAAFALRPPAPPACPDASAAMGEVWNDESRSGVVAAFEKTELDYASTAARTVTEQVDAWASQWTGAYRASCEGGDEAARERVCLEAQLAQLDGLVRVFQRANRSTVAGAGPGVSNLPEPELCSDPAYSELPVPDPADNERVQDLRLQLALASAEVISLEFEAGIAQLEDIHTRAEALGYEPLTAEVELALGTAYFKAGRIDDSERVLLDAVELSENIGHTTVRAEAWLRLMQLEGSVHRRFDEALRMSRPARAAIEGTGQARFGLQIRFESTVSEIHRLEGDYEQAETAARAAVDLALQHRGEDHLETALAYRTLALVLREKGQFDRALEYARKTVEVYERVLGPDHPETAGAVGSVATILALTDHDPNEVLELWQRAHAIHESAFPPKHRSQAVSAHGIAITLDALDRHEESIAYYEQAIEVDDANEGKDHPASVPTIYGLGMALLDLDRIEEGAAQIERAHEIIEPVIGKDHPDLSYTLAGLGLVAYLRSEPEAAREHFERARANLLSSFAADNTRLHKLHLDWAHAALRGEQFEDAIAALEHADSIAQGEGTTDVDRGRGAWLHAQILAQIGDLDGARASATKATQLDPGLGAEVEPWLAELK